MKLPTSFWTTPAKTPELKPSAKKEDSSADDQDSRPSVFIPKRNVLTEMSNKMIFAKPAPAPSQRPFASKTIENAESSTMALDRATPMLETFQKRLNQTANSRESSASVTIPSSNLKPSSSVKYYTLWNMAKSRVKIVYLKPWNSLQGAFQATICAWRFRGIRKTKKDQLQVAARGFWQHRIRLGYPRNLQQCYPLFHFIALIIRLAMVLISGIRSLLS